MIGKTLRCVRDVRTIDDVEALELFDYDELVPAKNVHDLFLATAALHAERRALTVLRSADPSDVEVSYTHLELLQEITRAQTCLRRSVSAPTMSSPSSAIRTVPCHRSRGAQAWRGSSVR